MIICDSEALLQADRTSRRSGFVSTIDAEQAYHLSGCLIYWTLGILGDRKKTRLQNPFFTQYLIWSEMSYWSLHIKVDELHGRWMLDDVALPLVSQYPIDT